MSWISALPVVGGLIDKALDRLLPDKKRISEGQIELNKLELQDAPRSYLRLWRPLLFWVISLCVLYLLLVQPVLHFYFPGVPLPNLPVDFSELLRLLLIGLGAGY